MISLCMCHCWSGQGMARTWWQAGPAGPVTARPRNPGARRSNDTIDIVVVIVVEAILLVDDAGCFIVIIVSGIWERSVFRLWRVCKRGHRVYRETEMLECHCRLTCARMADGTRDQQAHGTTALGCCPATSASEESLTIGVPSVYVWDW